MSDNEVVQIGSHLMSLCPQCDKKLFSRPALCPYCGALLTDESSPGLVEERPVGSDNRLRQLSFALSKKAIPRGVVGAIFGLAGTLVGLFLFFMALNEELSTIVHFFERDNAIIILFTVIPAVLGGAILGIAGVTGFWRSSSGTMGGGRQRGGWPSAMLGGFYGGIIGAVAGLVAGLVIAALLRIAALLNP